MGVEDVKKEEMVLDDKLKNSIEQNLKDPWLAVLLSKAYPGAGQIYAGAKTRGIFFIAFMTLLLLIIVLAIRYFLTSDSASTSRVFLFVALTAFLVMIVLSIYALFDAYKVAKVQKTLQASPTSTGDKGKSGFAAFLSSLLPGIGQFYNRQVFKGIGFIALVIVTTLLEDVNLFFSLLGMIVYLFGIKDAYDSAERANVSGGRFFHQYKTITLFIVIMYAIQVIPYSDLIEKHFVKAYKMPSGSMYPTMRIGDHILISKSHSTLSSLKRGDVVVFPYPVDPEKNFVKRVIGLGGDKIQFVNGDLYINDELIPTERVGLAEDNDNPVFKTAGPPTVYKERIGDMSYRVQYVHEKLENNGGPWLVPQEAVFVIGDNRNNSQDSRTWGPVPRNTIEGKVVKIYWSWDSADTKVRWERIGETIR